MKTGTVYRLIPVTERVPRSKADAAQSALAALDIPAHARERLRHELYRITEPDHARHPWGAFFMLSVQQITAIWDAIRELPPKDRPHEVRHALDLAVTNLRQDTGEIMLTRDELAERMKCRPQEVSLAMGVLERMGVVIKGDRRKVPGLRGRGVRPYFINPHAAWNGSLAGRAAEAERQEPPLLKLMQGGKTDQ